MSSATGRRRATDRHYSAEEQALDQISKEAEARIAARRAARAEAREIRMREIERQQREEEERLKAQDTGDSGIKTASSYSGSRRGSDDSTDSTETSSSINLKDPKDTVRQLKSQLRDLEEKYKQAMMTNAQLDNVKHTLVYQVELLKDQMEEQEETLIEVQREYKDRCKELEMKKRDYSDLQFELSGYKEQSALKDRLLKESGFVLVSSEEGEFSLERCSDMGHSPQLTLGQTLISSEAADMLNKAGDGSLDDKLKRFIEERKKLQEEIKSLHQELDEERSKKEQPSPKVPQMNGPEMQLYEVQREASKQIHEYKLKLQKAEQEIANLEGTVYRLETQVKRYKYDTEEAEKLEDELKTDRRRLQRELRECQTQVEELTNKNKHLEKRLEKIKQSRAALGLN